MVAELGRGNGISRDRVHRPRASVTMSSVFDLVLLIDWKNLPSTGMSPRNGSFWNVSVSRLSSSPPIAKLCPLSSSISVLTRLTAIAGTWNPDMVTALVKSSELTSGATWSRIVPRGVTVGMKFKRMPYSLN